MQDACITNKYKTDTITKQFIHVIYKTEQILNNLSLTLQIFFFNNFRLIHEKGIIKAIKALKGDSSPKLDGITVKMLN